MNKKKQRIIIPSLLLALIVIGCSKPDYYYDDREEYVFSIEELNGSWEYSGYLRFNAKDGEMISSDTSSSHSVKPLFTFSLDSTEVYDEGMVHYMELKVDEESTSGIGTAIVYDLDDMFIARLNWESIDPGVDIPQGGALSGNLVLENNELFIGHTFGRKPDRGQLFLTGKSSGSSTGEYFMFKRAVD